MPLASDPRRARLSLETLEERVTPTLAALTSTVSSSGLQQSEPSSAANAAGNRVVVWTHNVGVGSGDTDIYAQRLDANGNKVGPEIRVTNTSARESEADVCIDDAGRFTIVYTRDTITDSDLYIVRYNGIGQKLQEITVPTLQFMSEQDGHIACASSGDFVISYTRSSPTTTQDVFARMYTVGGLFRREIQVANSTLLSEADSDIARRPGLNSQFAVVYVVNNADVLSWRFDGNGNRLGLTPLRVAANAWSESNPTIAANPNVFGPAAYVVAWQHQISPLSFGTDIVARTIGQTGVLGPARLVQSDSMSDSDPSIAMKTNGDYIVAYKSQPQQSLGFFVRVSEVRASGAVTTLVAAQILGPVFTAVGLPTISTRPDGNYFVAFVLPLGSQFNSAVFGRKGTFI